MLNRGLNKVGPLDRQRPHSAVLGATQHASAEEVGTLADTLELPTGQRVERVHDSNKMLHGDRRDCIR